MRSGSPRPVKGPWQQRSSIPFSGFVHRATFLLLQLHQVEQQLSPCRAGVESIIHPHIRIRHAGIDGCVKSTEKCSYYFTEFHVGQTKTRTDVSCRGLRIEKKTLVPSKTYLIPMHFLDPTENGVQASLRSCSPSFPSQRSGRNSSAFGKAASFRWMV